MKRGCQECSLYRGAVAARSLVSAEKNRQGRGGIVYQCMQIGLAI